MSRPLPRATFRLTSTSMLSTAPRCRPNLTIRQSTNLVPEYVILGADPNALVAPDVVRATAPEESSAESGFWSTFRWQRVRDAWAETGAWLRSKLPAWGAP